MNVINSENELIWFLYKKTNDLKQCAEQAHFQYILDLIYTYISDRQIPNKEDFLQKYFITNNYNPHYQPFFSAEEIPTICEQLQISYLNSDFKIKNDCITRGISKENMIANGAVYTKKNIVEYIVGETLRNIKITSQIRILDFACGTGRFYGELITQLNANGISNEVAVTQCVDAIDINPVAINITRLKACSLLKELSEEKMHFISERIRCENALIQSSNSLELFSENTNSVRYDAIVSNPPYLVLKPSHKTSARLAEDIRSQVQFFRESGNYFYSIEGMLNLYQLSIERMLQMLKPYGEIGVICPSTLFADQSATNLRKHLLLHNKVRLIKYFPEKSNLFENNVTQATNIFFLQKNGSTDNISISSNDKTFIVNINLIKELFPQNMEIPFISDKDWQILKKINKFSRLKNIKTIRNKRGELDLTLNKEYITNSPTRYQLIRGKMITNNGVVRATNEYVKEDFVNTKSAEYQRSDLGKVRLVGQNICNIDNPQRLHFAFSSPTDILGNSCNYISSDLSTLKKLHILFSSTLLNWRFRLTSSNNHINNYELDELPITDLSKINENQSFSTEKELNTYVCSLYGLDKIETEYICNL